MTQISALRAESRKNGVFRSISLGALAAKALKQYDRDNADLRSINRQFSAFNRIEVINNSSVKIYVDLDFTTQKRLAVNANSVFIKDSVMFQEFNVTNASTTTAISDGEVDITVGYERPLLREAR